MATYKDQLHKIVEESSFPSDRKEDIKHDLKAVFDDGSMIGEMVGDLVSTIAGGVINFTGVDDLVSWTTDNIKSVVKEAVMEVLGSNELLNQMAESLAEKQAEREAGMGQEKTTEMGE